MSDINLSIVLYNNSYSEVLALVHRVIGSSQINRIYLVDNSERPSAKFEGMNKVKYIFNKSNIGYGSAHNIAIKESIEQNVKYHIVINPDIYVEQNAIEELSRFMDDNESVGMVMPQVLYPNGDIQYLCKQLPSPSDLFLRRFFSFTDYAKKMIYRYELRQMGDDIQFDIPSLSGCFMFFRIEVLKKIGLFDSRYFMYMEDVDLCRRVHQVARTAFYPKVDVIHAYGKGSYYSFKLMRAHTYSAIKYFNKWGWFFDKERKNINDRILQKITSK